MGYNNLDRYYIEEPGKFQSFRMARAFGYLYPGEIRAIHQLCLQCPEDGVFVNLGSGTGTSGLAIAEVRHDARRYTIDISTGGPLGGLENETNAFANTDMKPPIQMLGDAINVGESWAEAYGKDNKIDFLFIDDNHSYEHLHKEIEVWMKNMKPGGIMAFHDVDAPFWPGVRQAVDELMLQYKQILQVETLVAFHLTTK